MRRDSICADQAVAITKCAAPKGTIAIVDGDNQGWTKFGLGCPRDLLGAMVRESNCFTLHDASTGQPADFRMSAIAGDRATKNELVWCPALG